MPFQKIIPPSQLKGFQPQLNIPAGLLESIMQPTAPATPTYPTAPTTVYVPYHYPQYEVQQQPVQPEGLIEWWREFVSSRLGNAEKVVLVLAALAGVVGGIYILKELL